MLSGVGRENGTILAPGGDFLDIRKQSRFVQGVWSQTLLKIRVRGIRTDYDIPGRDAEGAWIGTPGSRRYRVDFWINKSLNIKN